MADYLNLTQIAQIAQIFLKSRRLFKFHTDITEILNLTQMIQITQIFLRSRRNHRNHGNDLVTNTDHTDFLSPAEIYLRAHR
jgi:hypothetical protein